MSKQLKFRLLTQPNVISQVGRPVETKYAAEQIDTFATELEEELKDLDPDVRKLAESLSVERFAQLFGVGMKVKAKEVAELSIARAVELGAAFGLFEVPVVEASKPDNPNTAADTKPTTTGDLKPEPPTKPADYTSTLIDSLPIHGTAKKSYKQAGLLTVGDLEAFAASRNLADVKGVAENWADDTLKAIKTLKGE